MKFNKIIFAATLSLSLLLAACGSNESSTKTKDNGSESNHAAKYDYRHADPTRLSGGQKQRVAIAGLLALQPEILLLDEAFVMLDPKSRKDLLKTLQKLKSRHQLTIISITHDMNEAASSDRIIVLKNGTISSIGTPKEVFSKELDFEAPFTEKLRRILQMKGRNVPNTYMSEEEMVEWLWK